MLVLEALADPSRRAIFTLLCERPTSVTVLADALPVSRPAVSQHLKVLRDAGLVTDRAEGTKRIYAVRPEALAAARSYFDDFWKRSLAAFQQQVESNNTSTHSAEQEQP